MEATIELIRKIVQNLNGYGFPVLLFIIGIIEFSFGLYKGKWPKNERWVDITCFIVVHL